MERLRVESYSEVFKLAEDRRIYRIDAHRSLPMPIPLRFLGYFFATAAAMFFASRLPLLGSAFGLLPGQLRYIMLPLIVGALGMAVRPDGRFAHQYAWDWLCYQLRARRHFAGSPIVGETAEHLSGGELSVFPDAGYPGLRQALVRGPASVGLPEPLKVRARRGGRVTARRASCRAR
jgi:TcpE family